MDNISRRAQYTAVLSDEHLVIRRSEGPTLYEQSGIVAAAWIWQGECIIAVQKVDDPDADPYQLLEIARRDDNWKETIHQSFADEVFENYICITVNVCTALLRLGTVQEKPALHVPCRPSMTRMSPDGKHFALASSGDVWIVRLDHNETIKIALPTDGVDRGINDVDWSASSNWVSFVSHQNGPGLPPRRRIVALVNVEKAQICIVRDMFEFTLCVEWGDVGDERLYVEARETASQQEWSTYIIDPNEQQCYSIEWMRNRA